MPSRTSEVQPWLRPADIVLAVLMAVFQCAVITGIAHWQPGHHVGPVGYGLLLLASLSLVPRRRFPLPVLGCTVLLVYGYYLLGFYFLHFALGPAILVVAVALYTVGSRVPLRTTVLAATIVILLVPLGQLVASLLLGRTPEPPWWALVPAAFAAVAVAVGVAVRSRRFAALAATERAREADQRKAEERRLAIAREVHDVVAHSLATINVQAGVAAHVADKRPEQAKEALLAIKDASQSALRDLRATLGVLRSGRPEHAPTPSLARVAELTDRATALGLRVEVHGDVSGLPAPVDAAAYRIVQEALTNTIRHADAATRIDVHIGRTVDRLTVRISDDGRPQAGPVEGNGLRGMWERVAALDGTFTAGPGGQGFTVRAEFPMRPDTAETE